MTRLDVVSSVEECECRASKGCNTGRSPSIVVNFFAQITHCSAEKKRKETEQTTPFGVNLVRSQVMHRAAEGTALHVDGM